MVEFLAIGAHAVRRGDVGAGQRVLVVGTGPIGMAALIFSRLRGAAVTALDTRAERIDFCVQTLGADAGVLIGPDDERELARADRWRVLRRGLRRHRQPRSAMERGFHFVAHGGRYVLVSIVRDSISFSDPEFHKRETTLLGSRNATMEDFETVLAAMRAGQHPRPGAQHAPAGAAQRAGRLRRRCSIRRSGSSRRSSSASRRTDPAVRHQPLPAGPRRPVRVAGAGPRRRRWAASRWCRPRTARRAARGWRRWPATQAIRCASEACATAGRSTRWCR